MELTEIDNYYIDAGWGTWGFKATPVSPASAWPSASPPGKQPDILEPFRLDRFQRFAAGRREGARPPSGTRGAHEGASPDPCFETALRASSA